ncbi:MAG: carbamoyltransferase C-terminal domain-containing protein [Candidatus Micrarchaeia archaeon]
MYILGIWDGHDAGAAIIDDNKIIAAVNEERLTKRKLDVGFPKNSIEECLRIAGIKAKDVEHVAATTIEFTKTLERMFPKMRENYYLFRRRKMLKPRFETFRHYLKYALTSIGPLPFCKEINEFIIRKELKKLGFENFKLHFVEHHIAHAADAAFTSPFTKALVITVDGLGDGISSSVNVYENNEIERIETSSAIDSIGIFFEQVTNIVGMRELEDEGKVMSMADYSYPFSFEENKLKDFFWVDGLKIKAKYSPIAQYDILSRIAWSMPREQFAYMAQQLLEKILVELFEKAIEETGMENVAWSGGVASNVKANMKIRHIDKLKRWYVFPHMGDGGLALGAALYVNYKLNGITNYSFKDVYLGPSYSEEEIKKALEENKARIKFEEISDPGGYAAELLQKNYVFWFRGRMEFGPRALGNRSILAPAGDEKIKNELNLKVKKREWFQPFAPSLLKEDSRKIIEDIKNKEDFDRFMTMAYIAKEEIEEKIKAVVHVDNSMRPQMVGEENKTYKKLLKEIKKMNGIGIILNTSFNIHGMPIVCSPQDAIDTMLKTKTKYMIMENFIVELK